MGAAPFALGVLSTTHTRGLPRRRPGLHDTDCTTLRQLGGTGFGSCGGRFWKPWRASRARFAPWIPGPRRGSGRDAIWTSRGCVVAKLTRAAVRQLGGSVFEWSWPTPSKPWRASRAFFAPCSLGNGVGVGTAPFGAACDRGSSSSCPASTDCDAVKLSGNYIGYRVALQHGTKRSRARRYGVRKWH